MDKKKDLTNTAGILEINVFPINYFALRQVFYFFPDAKETLMEMIKNKAEVA